MTGIGRKSMQGDIRFADVLEKMGATITWGDDFIACTRGELHAIDMDMNHIPDAAMTIATTALFAKGTTTLRNIYNWRVKETDRLFAMATELRKVGAEVEEGHDYIRITPPAKLQHADIGTYNDHRMAMCFSLVALSDTPVTIPTLNVPQKRSLIISNNWREWYACLILLLRQSTGWRIKVRIRTIFTIMTNANLLMI